MTGLKNNVIYKCNSVTTRVWQTADTAIVASTTYREFWQDLGIPSIFFYLGLFFCSILLLSVLLPFFGKPLSREHVKKCLPALVLVIIWSVPNFFLSISQQPLPHLGKLGFRHSTGILFPYYSSHWSIHHFEVRKGPNLPWETLPNSYFFVPELPLGGSRLEMYVVYSKRADSQEESNAVIDSLMDQMSERIKSDSLRFKDVCSVRLVTRKYSPVTDVALQRPFDADNLEEGWKLTGVLAEKQLEETCSEG